MEGILDLVFAIWDVHQKINIKSDKSNTKCEINHQDIMVPRNLTRISPDTCTRDAGQLERGGLQRYF